MKDKLTPWFPGSVRPVREGVYETDPQGSNVASYQYWNGEFWGVACRTPHAAELYVDLRSRWQDDAWRGLAANPKGKRNG